MALQDVPIPLIEACRRGESASIDQLVRLITPDVYRIAFSMLRDHDDADEVAQETLIKLFRYIHKLKDVDRFSVWVMRVVMSQVQTWRMKKGRRRFHEVQETFLEEESLIQYVPSSEETPREFAQRRQTINQIENAIATLPARQQTAVLLFELEGYSIKEVASVMTCSEGAVKFNLHEARKKLRHRLGHLIKGLFSSKTGTSAPTNEDDDTFENPIRPVSAS